jgi:hypothetical protein
MGPKAPQPFWLQGTAVLRFGSGGKTDRDVAGEASGTVSWAPIPPKGKRLLILRGNSADILYRLTSGGSITG